MLAENRRAFPAQRSGGYRWIPAEIRLLTAEISVHLAGISCFGGGRPGERRSGRAERRGEWGKAVGGVTGVG